MTLLIYNTLSRTKEPFVPLRDGRVGIYVCGPTVYDHAHLGHARCYVAFDTVVRYLRQRYQVTYVRNYTDVDDKIIKRAHESGEDPFVVSERFIASFQEDMKALGVAPADVEPKVTEHIPQIVGLVEKLLASGAAYAVGANVYYKVDKFPSYGKLGRRELDDMEAGARVEVDTSKHHPMDFALWKAHKPGEPYWPAPWGDGRPGWHIECSAMSATYLGVTLDLHAGGKDLIFPHHENEIAQSEAASGECFSRFWMHNGFVQIDEEKMSKSLGNFFTIKDLLQRFDAQSLRYFLLTTHYRSPISFSLQALEEAEARLLYVNETLAKVRAATAGAQAAEANADVLSRFQVGMDDDFNTAQALGDMALTLRRCNELVAQTPVTDSARAELSGLYAALRQIGSVLGIMVEEPEVVKGRIQRRRQNERGIDPARIESLIAERQEARRMRNFQRADAIRQELQEMGVQIKDGSAGTTWEICS